MVNMGNMMNGMFGKVANGMCKISMNGEIAIKTSNGYKTYDVENNHLVNCDSFAIDVGSDFFFIIPTNKVSKGDIILAGGKPSCVIEVKDNEIKVFRYEDGTINFLVPEHHVFMGKTYFYGKIVSMFGNLKSEKGMGKMMKFYMMSQMFGSNKSSGGADMSQMMPMMMMMMSSGMDNMFDGMFDFGNDEEEEDKAE